jgi:hypothetical protein
MYLGAYSSSEQAPLITAEKPKQEKPLWGHTLEEHK